MKQQIKTPEKKLNKMETNNVSDAEFKTLVIRMLKGLIGYFNSIKTDQVRNKVYTKRNKENIQGINNAVDEAENQINDLEHKEERKHSIRAARRRRNP